MQLVHYNKKKVLLPSGWEDLTQKQFLRVTKIFHGNISNENYFLDEVLRVVSRKNIFAFFRMPVDMRVRCFPLIEFLYKEPVTTKQLVIKYKGLYGPADYFDNIILSEFHHSELAYHLHITEKDNNALDELIAIIYRAGKPKYNKKKNTEGDIRVPFFYSEVFYNKRKIKKWPLYVKQAILLWYDACRQQLAKDYALAFSSSGTGMNDNFFEGNYKMIRSLAGTKYGSFEDVEQMSVHLAFREIVESINDYNELKRKHPEMYE